MRPHLLRDALVGLGYLIVIASLIALSVLVYNHAFTRYVTVALHTDSVGSSLQKGSDVKVRGVLIGSVSGISTDGTGALIHLQLDPSKVGSLPSNMLAQLLPKTMFGERFVALEFPADPSSSHLSSGDTIDQDTSKQSIELEKLFSDLLPVLQAVKPEKLAATLGELAAALRGRGDDLASTMQTVGSYLERLAPAVPQLTADLKSFARVARTYSTAAPALITGLNSLTTASKTLVAQRADYTNLLAATTSMADTVGTFVGTNEDQIIGLSRNSLPSLRIVAKYAGEFPCLTRTLTGYIPTADAAFGAGTSRPGAHVILHVVPASKRYTSADRPTYSTSGKPSCPYSSVAALTRAQVGNSALANTALGYLPGVRNSDTGTPLHSTPAHNKTSHSTTSHPAAQLPTGGAGIGAANSPQENQLIAELVAPTIGVAPNSYPKWASLLIGPALRGAEVSLR